MLILILTVAKPHTDQMSYIKNETSQKDYMYIPDLLTFLFLFLNFQIMVWVGGDLGYLIPMKNHNLIFHPWVFHPQIFHPG